MQIGELNEFGGSPTTLSDFFTNRNKFPRFPISLIGRKVYCLPMSPIDLPKIHELSDEMAGIGPLD